MTFTRHSKSYIGKKGQRFHVVIFIGRDSKENKTEWICPILYLGFSHCSDWPCWNKEVIYLFQRRVVVHFYRTRIFIRPTTEVHFAIFVWYFMCYLTFVCLWCCTSADLSYDKQIASLRRFYSSSDWDEWFHLDREQSVKFLQVNLWFAHCVCKVDYLRREYLVCEMRSKFKLLWYDV